MTMAAVFFGTDRCGGMNADNNAHISIGRAFTEPSFITQIGG